MTFYEKMRLVCLSIPAGRVATYGQIAMLCDAPRNALSGDLTAYAQGLHSGNKMLDVILEKYLRSCRQNGIDFHFEVRACNLSQVAPTDLVTVLGNLLASALSRYAGDYSWDYDPTAATFTVTIMLHDVES